MEMVVVENVRKSFGDTLVLDGVSMKVARGMGVMIIGPNACGKTTLLKIIAGILKPDSGRVLVNGVVSMVFQEDLMMPWLSMRDNLALLLRLKGVSRREAFEEVEELSQKLGISEYLELRPQEVSGGTLRKASIARALTLHPDILLLDEPLIELDQASRSSVVSLLDELRGGGTTLVITTHYPDEVQQVVDYVYHLTPKPTRVISITQRGGESVPVGYTRRHGSSP